MIHTPAFNPGYQVETIADQAVFFLSESEPFFLSGRSFALTAAAIDGQKTADELVDALEDELLPQDVYFALLEMEKRGVLLEATDALSPQACALLTALRTDVQVQTAGNQLRNTTVQVTSCGSFDASPLTEKLAGFHLQVKAAGDFDLVLTDDYLREELRAYNQEALASQRPWLLAKPAGNTLWIGPFFRPQETGCWACLEQRLRGHRQTERLMEQLKKTTVSHLVQSGIAPSVSPAAWEMIATETAKAILLRDSYELSGTVVSVNLLTLQTRRHLLTRRPQCPACGTADRPAASAPPPLFLQSGKKHPDAYGGDRTETPETTLSKYGHHISPITGIVEEIRSSDSTEPGAPIHNATAGLNEAVTPADSLSSLPSHLRTYTGGKGVSAAHAQAGALCEALERYSGRFQGDEYRVQSSFAALGDTAIHPNGSMLFSEKQYLHREDWNARQQLAGMQVPLPFDEQRVLDWSPVWSLTEERFKYLPTSYCYYKYPSEPDALFCRADSNGCAAGNTAEEAILQGFMELVERDGVAIWWYNRLKRGAVDLESFALPYVQQMQDYYRSIGREMWVIDLTTDLGIPIFAAVSRVTGQSQERILFGFGAHFNPETALLRALTEMNQFLPVLLEWERTEHTHSVSGRWWKTATLESQPYLQPDASVPLKKASDFGYVRQDDLLEDVRRCQAIVEQQGMELLVLDQTRPDVGLPVVKVIVPGLRHFWNRFGAGRLYEVPVRMGWLEQAHEEAELNPIPVFF